MMNSFVWYIQATTLVAVWVLANFQHEVSGACSKDPPRIIPDDQLKFLRYSIVIDAGSSGSRIHVYSWNELETVRVRLPDFRHIFCVRTTPGVSECKSNSEIKDHILNLINATVPYIPETLQSKTPIHFMATAGMRMMLEDKANNATNYIDGLLKDKELNPFLYRSPENARVLSGEEEGIFAWIAANYLGKVFTTYGTRSRNTRGILELGGASTQIAFAPKGNIFDNKYPVTIAGVTYSLYVHSYLIYGQEQVDVWIRDKIVQNAKTLENKERTAANPCMLKGDSVVKLVGNVSINFAGQGDPDKCLELLDQLIYKPLEPWRCNPKPCGIGNTYQPSIHPNMDFYVMGAFIYPLKNLRILQPDGTFSLQNVTIAAKEFCRKSTSEILKQQTVTDASLLSRECLTGLYMPELFQKAYRFKNDTKQLRAPVKPHSTEIEWPLGAVIYEYEHQRCDVKCPSACPSTSASMSVHSVSVEVYIVSFINGLFLTAVLWFNGL